MERKERIVSGRVYLVGAGPGSADLITVRGLRLLQTADVLLHDALISQDLIDEASVHAEIISVGKRGYCTGSTRQETINDALVRLAREGKSVCRLKWGDPCVFGRDGEEAEILAEIVPGVTSAVGACAAAGIPLTHRDVGQALAVWFLAPREDRMPGRGRSFAEMTKPLKNLRVREYGLHYTFVFGAYVALSNVLPNFYYTNYGAELTTSLSLGEQTVADFGTIKGLKGEAYATYMKDNPTVKAEIDKLTQWVGILAAICFVLPASLLRPLGGWLSDRHGAKVVMWSVFVAMSAAGVVLTLSLGLGVWRFTTALFMLGVGMGVGCEPLGGVQIEVHVDVVDVRTPDLIDPARVVVPEREELVEGMYGVAVAATGGVIVHPERRVPRFVLEVVAHACGAHARHDFFPILRIQLHGTFEVEQHVLQPKHVRPDRATAEGVPGRRITGDPLLGHAVFVVVHRVVGIE